MKFMDEEIPKEKKFLFNYFKKPLQKTFIKYIIFFESYENFRDHTGYVCQDRWLKSLYKKYKDLLILYDKLKKQTNLEELSRLDCGKIKINKKYI